MVALLSHAWLGGVFWPCTPLPALSTAGALGFLYCTFNSRLLLTTAKEETAIMPPANMRLAEVGASMEHHGKGA